MVYKIICSFPFFCLSGDSAEDELSLDEQYEEKLRDAMDLALEKSASNRVKGLQQVEKALLKRSMGDFLEGRRETITDIIDRSLKRGKGLEQTSAANLAIIVCVQLHGDEGVFRGLEETLNKLMLDASVAPKVRAACANTLAVLAFLCLHAEEYK